MKKIYVLAIASLSLGSCNDDFLELAPVSNANVKNFYRNAADMKNAVNAAYGALQMEGQYRSAYWQLGEVRSDNTISLEVAGNFPDAEIDLFKEPASNTVITAAWNDNYKGILLCNIVLDRIGGVTMDEVAKNQFIGEAEFLRALMYFNLVRVFGDVPLVLHETLRVEEGYAQARVAKTEVYKQIIADLNDASAKLPEAYSGADIGRATKGAAKALLGKVYLTVKDYQNAAAKLKEVIDQGNYQLLANYADLWKVSNENNAESIFEVQFKKGGTGTGSSFYNLFAPWNSEIAVTGVGFAFGRNLPNSNLIAAYEVGDLRKASSIAESYIKNGQTINDPYTLKYRDQPFAASDADNNWPVLRYADVLLMYAEALNELNQGPTQEAYSMINAVRERADLAPLDGLDYPAFVLALEHERQVELAFEGHRWFDLVRTGRALTVMNEHFKGTPVIQEYQLVFPVPQSQINVNPEGIKQNPGYNF